MPPEQERTGEVMAILPTSAMRQKASRLCFIPTHVTITRRDLKQALSRLLPYPTQERSRTSITGYPTPTNNLTLYF